MREKGAFIMWEKDTLQELYREIFVRKSVRKYSAGELDGAVLDAIRAAGEKVVPLIDGGPGAFRVLTRDQVEKPFKDAPYYLGVYAKTDADSRIHAAFMLQQMSLWLSTQGIGSCWVGAGRAKPEFASLGELRFSMLIAFGSPAEELHRRDSDEFKRKPIGEITDTKGMEHIVEALRLAPSAINRQAWYVSGDNNSLRLFTADSGPVMKKMFDVLNLMDSGIGLCHLWLAAQQHNVFLSFSQERETIQHPKKYHYIWTVNLKNK